MRIPKKLILKVANDLLEEQGRFTQVEIQERIEKKLGRRLSINEKRRITQILRNEFIVDSQTRDRSQYKIYIYFIL